METGTGLVFFANKLAPSPFPSRIIPRHFAPLCRGIPMDYHRPMAHDSPNPASPLTLAIIGCGSRGWTFAAWAKQHPDQARVVAVADPIQSRRDLDWGRSCSVGRYAVRRVGIAHAEAPAGGSAHQHHAGSTSRRLGPRGDGTRLPHAAGKADGDHPGRLHRPG